MAHNRDQLAFSLQNMVDYEPFKGNYSGTIVQNNTIRGGFSTDAEEAGDTKGSNNETAIIKCVHHLDILACFFY